MSVHSYKIRCYRETPGDTGCRDVPAFADNVEGGVELAGQMLLAFFEKLSGDQQPHKADLVDHDDGQVVARIRVVGPGRAERLDH